MGLAILSPAKINLDLAVLGRRSDNYHEIETILQTVALYDRIFMQPGASGINLFVTEGAPAGSNNLCYKAAAAFYDATRISPAITIKLEKTIPQEAGLGGGSSNAAYTLLGLNAWHGHPLEQAHLMAVAAQIGSDVPFFLWGGTAKATGRGEVITPLPDHPRQWLRIIKPPFGLSTALVYSRWQAGLAKEHRPYSNDLEEIALAPCPELVAVKELLAGDGAEKIMLCGSGSAMCGFYPARPTTALSLLEGYREFIVPTISEAECRKNVREER